MTKGLVPRYKSLNIPVLCYSYWMQNPPIPLEGIVKNLSNQLTNRILGDKK